MTGGFPAAQPHGALEPIFEDAWYLTGSVQFKPLVRLSRNMVVLRHEGELTVINAIRLNAEGEAALAELGRVAHVVKIGFHGMDDGYYLDRYDARYCVVDGMQVGDDAERMTDGGAFPVPGVRVLCFEHTIQPEAALLVERDGGLLITCDSVQHWVDRGYLSPLARLITGVMGFKKPAQIGPPWREKQTPAGGSLKADFERIAALPFERIIGGHGGLAESGGAALLQATIAREFGD